jgi:DNA helicase HerA-like ATPase
MTSPIQSRSNRVVGTVEEVSADRIKVLLDPDAPQATALNTGSPAGFPRINGYVLIPNESGATVGVISSVSIQRLPYPKRKGTQKDFDLIDLPFPARLVTLTPLGTLVAYSGSGGKEITFKVRRGVDVFPSVGDPVLLPGSDQLQAIVEGESGGTPGRILLGHCPTAGRAPVHVDPDKLFGRHLAVLGNTGAGKSCSVAGLVRWSIRAAEGARVEAVKNDLEGSKRSERPNARFIVLDPNGEYARAFQDFDDVRLFRVEPKAGEGTPLKVPAWLWNGEEWAAFTGAAPGVQRPILFEALRRLRSPDAGRPDEFETRVRGRVRRYRNRIRLALHSGDHQAAGRREGVAHVLLVLHEDFEALAQDVECADELRDPLQNAASTAQEVESSARQPGGRTKDDGSSWHDDFAETRLEEVIEALQSIASAVGLPAEDSVFDESTPRFFDANELPGFVEALAADQSGRDIARFVDTLNLRIRSLLARGRLSSVLQSDDACSIVLEDWLTEHIGADQAENGTIAVIDLSLVPSEVIHILVSVVARMVFEAVQRYRREEGRELPTALVLEEAHTFVHRDLSGNSGTPAGRACGRVFERIAREGRKFGLGLVLSSQRPSEISETVLSQCNTFLLHRIVNDRDQELVKRLVPDGLGALLRDLPSLPTRRAILLGWAAPAPVLVEIRDIPEPMRPHSPDPAFWRVWIGDEQRSIDWAKIAASWQGIEATPGATDPNDDQDVGNGGNAVSD